jgi:hypothetical protein
VPFNSPDPARHSRDIASSPAVDHDKAG